LPRARARDEGDNAGTDQAGESQYVAEGLGLPVVTQAGTLDELAANIREAISLHLEYDDLAELGMASEPRSTAGLC
jgi:predicted RNase H-like HicB family nuclease